MCLNWPIEKAVTFRQKLEGTYKLPLHLRHLCFFLCLTKEISEMSATKSACREKSVTHSSTASLFPTLRGPQSPSRWSWWTPLEAGDKLHWEASLLSLSTWIVIPCEATYFCNLQNHVAGLCSSYLCKNHLSKWLIILSLVGTRWEISNRRRPFGNLNVFTYQDDQKNIPV